MDIKLFIINCFSLLILYINPFVEADAPLGFCTNEYCSDPISKGVTILHYNSPDDSKISVEVNQVVHVYVKEYGPKKDLWGIIVNGNRGYISKQFIRETHLFTKRLVPAAVEFKSFLPISDSYTVSSHLQESSQQFQSDSFINDAVPESLLHSQTAQQGSISTLPSSFQQQQGNPMENLQSSHLSPNWNSDGNVQSNSRFDPSPQFDVPVQSSHFHPGHISPSSYSPDIVSKNILPAPTPIPDVKHPSHQSFSGDDLLNSPLYDNSLKVMNTFQQINSPDLLHSGPNPVFQSQSVPDINQHPASQPQQFQPPLVSQMHSPNLYDFEAEMAKTYAMLSDRGFDNTDMYANSYTGPDVQQSSQNVKSDFGSISESELNSIPSQLQYPPVLSNDNSFYASVNPSQPVEDPKVVNSDTAKEFFDNANEPPKNIVVDEDESTEENLEDNDESDNETDDISNDDDDEEENESLDSSETDNPPSIPELIMNTDAQFHLQSSMSSTENQQTSEVHQDMQNTMRDSNLVDVTSTQQATFAKSEKSDLSPSEPVSSNTNSIQLETDMVTDASVSHSAMQSNTVDQPEESSISFNISENSEEQTGDVISNAIKSHMTDDKPYNILDGPLEAESEPFPKNISDVSESNDALSTNDNTYDQEPTTPKINEFFVESDQNSDLDNIASTVEMDGIDDLTTYQNRNLKGEFGTTEEQQSDSDGGGDENTTQSDSEVHSSIRNWFDSLKVMVDYIMSWIPDPLYSALMDLQNKGLSPRVPVFTALCGVLIIFLIVPIIFIKEHSKESKLIAQLTIVEKNAYQFSVKNNVLQEKLENVQSELASLKASLAEEKSTSENLQMGFNNQNEDLENAKAEIESCLQTIESLKEKEVEYLTSIRNQEKQIEWFGEHKEALDKIMKDQENSITDLTDQLQESENKLKELENEKSRFLQLKEDYEEKLAQFDKSCNQLLQEAEVWNLRVQELTSKLDEEMKSNEESIETIRVKDEEIESLKQLVETFNVIDEIEDPEEQAKAKEEKLQSLLDASMIVNQLKQEEDKSKVLDEQLVKEKNRILDMEVELLDAQSEIDKLKMSYNQALQDKAEAQTKLDVLTNYFKDKEIQLQKQLGAQEAVRQKKEEDANSAERRICLIEQENASYKYQVASMKQEMEETERNLKSQIATQEKKAHESWIAARAAERKLEDMKQEDTQLRQRLTLLEREQENWANASRDEIIRPVPKRMPGVNDESGNQDLNISERGMFPHPHDRLPPAMMLPPDRPLPPLPPPPMPPMFMPHMERHFRPQPWHIPHDHSSDYRTTPPEFMAGRELTPPRGRASAIMDGDTGPHASSPLTTDTRDSRNSTPPHLLPDFHDVPPQPGRHFFPPPPLGHHRLPMHPPFRRDAGPGPKRLDHPNEFNSRGPQQGPPQEQWQHSRV